MMADAALAAVQAGETRDPMIAAIWWAEAINARNHGILVQPWELAEMPEGWLEMYKALIGAGQVKRKEDQHRARLGRYRDDFRRSHPTYRK